MGKYKTFDYDLGKTECITVKAPRFRKYEAIQIGKRLVIAGTGMIVDEQRHEYTIKNIDALVSMMNLWYSLSDDFRIDPNNVLGKGYSDDDIDKIIKWCCRFGLVLDNSMTYFDKLSPEDRFKVFTHSVFCDNNKTLEENEQLQRHMSLDCFVLPEEEKMLLLKYSEGWFYVDTFRVQLYLAVTCTELLARVLLDDDDERNCWRSESQQRCYDWLLVHVSRTRVSARIVLKGLRDVNGDMVTEDKLQYYADDIFQAIRFQCALIAVSRGNGIKRCENCHDLFRPSRPNKKRCDKPECDRRAVSRRKLNEMKARQKGGIHSAEES